VGPLNELTIGIDARAATEVAAGRGRFVRELLRALGQRDDPVLYRCYARTPWRNGLDERFSWRLIEARDPWWHVLTARAASRECEVFLSSNSYLTTWMLSVPAVPVIHDMVAFDRRYRPRRTSALIERLTLGIAVRRSRSFIAVSEATASDFVARYPSAEGRVTVAHLGVGAALSSPVESADRSSPDRLPAAGFVLAVGTLEPRKNLPRLVAAYGSLDGELQREHPLVVVGEVGWQAGATLDSLRSLGERCIMLGHVSDAELGELYRRCAVFCYPSLYEGFGLPVLEAMSAGAAVLTANVSSLPEVAGEAAAYVDPLDTHDIAEQLARLLRSPHARARLGEAGRERARQFDWSNTARVVLETLTRAAA